MAGIVDLTKLPVTIADLDHKTAADLLSTPSLATGALARPGEFFLAERLAQVYEGDPEVARDLITGGADI